MKVLAFVILFLIFGCFTLKGQIISGYVSDASTGLPLPGANVITLSGEGTTTDPNGFFKIPVSSGATVLTISFLGYETFQSDTLSAGVNSRNLTFKLQPVSASLEEVVVSSGRFEQRLEEMTVSLDVIKPDLLQDKNLNLIEDALQQAPGVNITEGQANIRSGSGWSYGAGTRVQTIVDGIPLISGDANQAQWDLVPVYSIRQMEILKGASSAIYGSAAMNGVISVLTPGFPDKEKFTANLYTGFYDAPSKESLRWWGKPRFNSGGNFSWEKAFNEQHGMALSGGQVQDQGFHYLEYEHRSRLYGKYFFRPQKIPGLEMQLAAHQMYSDNSNSLIWQNDSMGYVPLDSNITNAYGWDFYIDPAITYQKGRFKHTIQGRYLKINNNVLSDTTNYTNFSDFYFGQYYLQYFGPGSLVLTGGISLGYTKSRSVIFVGDHRTKNHAAFLQADCKPFDWLNINAGLRYENYFIDGRFFDQPVFRSGLNARILKHLSGRVSYGQAFRYPSIAETFTKTSVGDIVIYPNPDLQPESGSSAEIGLRQMFATKKVNGYIDVAVFQMHYQDMMEYNFSSWGKFTDPLLGFGFKAVNIGETNINGAELVLNLEGKLSEKTGYRILGGYTYTNPRINNPAYIFAYTTPYDTNGRAITYELSSTDSSGILKYRYQHLIKLDVQLSHQKFQAGFSIRYNDFMKNIDRVFNDLIPGVAGFRNENRHGDLLIDARAGIKINNTYRLDLLVENLLNRLVMIRPAYLGPPRSFSVRFQYSPNF